MTERTLTHDAIVNAYTAATVRTRYLGPTNHRGSRVVASLPSGAKKTVNWDHGLNPFDNHALAAAELLQAEGMTLAAGNCLVSDQGDGYSFSLRVTRA